MKNKLSLRSRRLGVVGVRKNGRVSPSHAPVLSCAHYFQAPATQAKINLEVATSEPATCDLVFSFCVIFRDVSMDSYRGLRSWYKL